MAIDDSFKKPGAVPFKWEIRPGVPKIQKQPPPPSPSFNLRRSLVQQQQKQLSCTTTPAKLRPPPAGFYYFQPPPPEVRTRSFHSVPRTRSESGRFSGSIITQPPEIVVSGSGCFPSPLLSRRKNNKRRVNKPKTKFDQEPDYSSDLETLSRWSLSTRKSLHSPFRDSALSSSFSSSQSSPRPMSDADWAGFGLF